MSSNNTDNPYQALAESDAGAPDGRWAFGSAPTDDPVAGIDAPIPSDVDTARLAAYCLMLGDDALVMSHRLQEWCTRAPELEDEVAVANIALDLLGQARLLYARAGQAEGAGRGEDSFAYFRTEGEFRNVLLVEQPRGDFGRMIATLLIFATWRLAVLHRLAASRDPVLAAIAGKGVKELTYHRDYAAGWTVRLGGGTEESHRRMQVGLRDAWPLVEELFTPHEVELDLAVSGIAVNPAQCHAEFDRVLAEVCDAAKLSLPAVSPAGIAGGVCGRDGAHTEHLVDLLAELQSLARAHPEAIW